MSKNKRIGCGCDYCMSRGIRRDFRQSHDGPEELPHRPKRAKMKPKRKGCEANNGGQHIYVWVEFIYTMPSWRDAKVKMTRVTWEKVCIGCNKRYTRTWTKPDNIYQTIKGSPWTVLP